MPPRFDDDELSLSLSVADLLERDAGRKIGFSQRSGFERMWLGQAIHSRYQSRCLENDPSYRSEVGVTVELDYRGWKVFLRGRIDGVRQDDGDGLVIEEIKSVRPGVPLLPAIAEMYRRQACLYAWMLSRSAGVAVEVGAELVLIEIGGDDSSVERLRLEVDPRSIEAGVKRRLNQLLHEHHERREARARRRLAAQSLEFPFHRPRPGQDRILEAVGRALENREHLLIEAATGLGKTVACLFPVLRYALEHDKRVFVLTAKTLQQAMANQVLDLLNREGHFHSIQLRAKSKMCANDEILCHEEYCRFAKEYFPKLQQSQLVPRLLERYPSLLPDAIFDAAKNETVCPFEVSLELATEAQAVVCDYNYAFDPYVQLHEFGDDNELDDTILVVDEIHNLVGRGRDYYSPDLSSLEARAVAAAIARSATGPIAGRLHSLATEIAELIESTVDFELGGAAPSPEISIESTIPGEELWRLRPALDRAFVEQLEHRRETRTFQAEDPFVGLYFGFLRFLNTLQLAEKAPFGVFSHCLLRRGEDRRLKLLCKDASRYLGHVIGRSHSTFGLSATLSPPEFYRDLLGFGAERTSELQVMNPFPRDHRRIVVDSTVRTTYRERERFYQPIASRLAEFANAVPGNTLALFPSYRFLSAVAERLPAGHKRVLVQRRTDSDSERDQMLETLRNALFGDVLLLAVAGGVFAEGVDYPGEMLHAVAVIGPCLPAVSLEQKLLESYYEERYERGFEYAFVIPGMTRVVQAAGRLIRSAEDRGVIALFDRRFLSAIYRRHMPSDWLEENGKPLRGHPATVAAAFFAESPAGEDRDDEESTPSAHQTELGSRP